MFGGSRKSRYGTNKFEEIMREAEKEARGERGTKPAVEDQVKPLDSVVDNRPVRG